MKIFITFIIFIASISLFAANKPIYQIDYELMARGEVLSSGIIIVEEGKTGEIQSGEETQASIFSAQINSSIENKLAVDYNFKNLKDGKSITVAKKALAMNSGKPEVSNVKDSSGGEFQFKVTVTEK